MVGVRLDLDALEASDHVTGRLYHRKVVPLRIYPELFDGYVIG